MIVGEEPPIFAGQPMLPQREPPVQASARGVRIAVGEPGDVESAGGSQHSAGPPHREERGSPGIFPAAPAPALTPERSRHHRQEIALPSAVGEAMDITNQPRQPAEPARDLAGRTATHVRFRPRPPSRPFWAISPVWIFPIRVSMKPGAAKPTPSAQKPPVNTQATLPEPAAAAPPPAPNEPQTPPSSALPMRPAVVLSAGPPRALPPVQQVKQTVKSVTISQVAPQAKAPRAGSETGVGTADQTQHRSGKAAGRSSRAERQEPPPRSSHHPDRSDYARSLPPATARECPGAACRAGPGTGSSGQTGRAHKSADPGGE